MFFSPYISNGEGKEVQDKYLGEFSKFEQNGQCLQELRFQICFNISMTSKKRNKSALNSNVCGNAEPKSVDSQQWEVKSFSKPMVTVILWMRLKLEQRVKYGLRKHALVECVHIIIATNPIWWRMRQWLPTFPAEVAIEQLLILEFSVHNSYTNLDAWDQNVTKCTLVRLYTY